MDEFEFSEDEIRKELENLGYFNVHQSRLTEFKRGILAHCQGIFPLTT